MEAGTTNTDRSRHAILSKGSWWSQLRGSNPWMARYVYSVIFLVVNMLAWAVRDYGHGALKEFKRMNTCEGGKECLGTEGVLRVSLGCFIFYFMMFLSTTGTSKLYTRRELWHSGWWSAKILSIIGLLMLTFFLPSQLIQIYGEIAHFGAGVFLLIQLISIISFIVWLNDCCQSEKNAPRCHVNVLLLATGAYVVCIVGSIMLYVWYTPKPSCLLNIFFITWTLVLIQLMTSASLHPNINAGFLTPGLMGLYLVFLCWSAIRSEPPDSICLKKAQATTKGSDWLTIFSFIIAVLAIVIATFSTGIDSQCFQFKKEEAKNEDDVPYGFGFFHLVFSTGAMYFAMLLIGWNSNFSHSMKRWTIDVGWTSTWVRIVNEWLAACVYLWMLVAPLVWKSRKATEPAGGV